MTFHSPSGSSADRKRVSDVTEEPAIKQQEVDLKLRDSGKLRDREHEAFLGYTLCHAAKLQAPLLMCVRVEGNAGTSCKVVSLRLLKT